MTPKRYVILTSQEACDAYVNDIQWRYGDIVVPVGPEALHLVKERRLPTLHLWDLLQVDDVDAHQERNAIFIQTLVDKLNALSMEYDPELHFGDYFRFQFLTIFWPILNDARVVSGLAKRARSASVLVFCDMSDTLFMKYRIRPGTYLSKAIAHSPEFIEGQVTTVQLTLKDGQHSSLTSILKDRLPDLLIKTLRWVRDNRRLGKFAQGHKTLLLTGGGFEWFEVVKHPEFLKDFSIKQMPLSAMIMFESRTLDQALAFKIKEMLVEVAGVLFLGNTKFLDSLATILAGEIAKFSKMKRCVDRFLENHSAVVSSVLCYPEENFIAHRARMKGRPVLIWQHGEKGFSHDELDRQYNLSNEFLYATDYLAYGDLVADLYKEQIGENELIAVTVVGLQRQLPLPDVPKHIVYATGKWSYNVLNDDMTIDADRRLYEAQNTILKFLDSSDVATDVIFKLNNTAGLNMIPVKLENVQIDGSSRFTDLLPNARVVILDAPATTLIEACRFDVPIFVLGGRRQNYRKEFSVAVRRRVCWCETPEELVDRLSDYFQTGRMEADRYDRTFIESYLTADSSAQVADRVHQCVDLAILRRN